MKKILITVAALILTACGFHLKGNNNLLGTLPYQSWYIGGVESMQLPLEKALLRADGRRASPSDAQAAIMITNLQTRRDIYTITRAADINEFLLILRVEAQAAVDGKAFGTPIQVVVERKMDFADSEVLGKQEEEATIWSEMHADAADQIVQRLMFLKAR